MKRVLSSFITLLFPFLGAAPAFAASHAPSSPSVPSVIDACADKNEFEVLCGLGINNVGELIQLVLNLLFIVAVIVAVIILIYGGIRWTLSRGDKEKIETARHHIVAAIVGLIFVFLAFFIINVVIGLFIKDFNLGNIIIPRLNP